MIRLVVWVAFVCYFSHGYPQGDRTIPVNKRSDYSMYDNQFFKVGDTPMDNEVTDCDLVRHQYARGFIRLREFLERMEGCGIKGKMKNVAGIAASTTDAADIPSDDSPTSQNTGAKAAPFKPQPIGNVIDNVNNQKPKIAAYQNQGLNQLPSTAQQGIQRSQTFNNFGFISQENGPLSYSPNPAATAVQTPVARKMITKKNMNIPQAQAIQNLNGAKNKKWPNPQRYFSDQATAMAQPYSAPAVAVGQPLVRPNPFPMAFHQQVQVTSASPKSQPQAFQPANPDVDIDKTVKPAAFQNVVKPVKQVSHVQPGKIRDDINGDQVLNEGVQDEANEDTIDNEESDPLPPETSFTFNPNLEQEDSSKEADAKAEAENSAGNNLPNNPQDAPPLNNTPNENQPGNDDISDGPGVKVTKQKAIDKAFTQKDQKAKPPNPQQSSNAVKTVESAAPKSFPQNVNIQTPKPAMPKNASGAIKGDDLDGVSEHNKLDEFLKPSSTSEVKPDQPDDVDKPDADKKGPGSKEAATTKKPGGLAINLDVLKNRISSSKDVGFLKRMLTLIKKITHHKDFNKLGGVQKNAIMQAGKAVDNAVTTNYGNVGQRSSIQPRPANWAPGLYTAQGYVAPSNGISNLMQQNQVQRSFIQTQPPKWKPGDYTAQGYGSQALGVNSAYPSYQASFQSRPPHWKPGDYTAGTGSANAQVSKKFQIERNPYYQSQPQRPVSYTPPYYSLRRLNYGLYNGNTP